ALFFAIGYSYPEQMSQLVNSNSAIGQAMWGSMFGVFIPYFFIKFILGGKKIWTILWESSKVSFFMGLLAVWGLILSTEPLSYPTYPIAIVLAVMGMTMGMAYALFVARMLEAAFYTIVLDKKEGRGEKHKRDSFSGTLSGALNNVLSFESDGREKLLYIEYD